VSCALKTERGAAGRSGCEGATVCPLKMDQYGPKHAAVVVLLCL